MNFVFNIGESEYSDSFSIPLFLAPWCLNFNKQSRFPAQSLSPDTYSLDTPGGYGQSPLDIRPSSRPRRQPPGSAIKRICWPPPCGPPRTAQGRVTASSPGGRLVPESGRLSGPPAAARALLCGPGRGDDRDAPVPGPRAGGVWPAGRRGRGRRGAGGRRKGRGRGRLSVPPGGQ